MTKRHFDPKTMTKTKAKFAVKIICILGKFVKNAIRP